MKSRNPHINLNLFSNLDIEYANHAWSQDNKQKLIQFIQSNPGCTVVFDADGTLWGGDVSETFFRWLLAERKLMNIDYASVNYESYTNHVASDPIAAYRWIVTIMAGLEEKNIITWANQFFSEYFVSRIYTAQKELIHDLQKQNCDVWIVTASHEWIVKAGAAYLGIQPSRVVGVRLVVHEGVLTDQIVEPFPYQAGKVLAINKYISPQPALIVGDSMADIPMLQHASQLAVFISHGQSNHDAAEVAKQSGFMIQYFPLLPELAFHNKVDPTIVNHACAL